MKSPPTAKDCIKKNSTTTLEDDETPVSSIPFPPAPLRLPESMKRAVLGCAITLSTLQHASLLLSIELTAVATSTVDSTIPSQPFSFALILLLLSTAVSACTLAFLLRTRRVWPSLLVFACHVDLLALALALRYGIASEFFAWLGWVPVLFFLVGAPRCAFATLCGLFFQGFLVHFTTASNDIALHSQLPPETKLVNCGLGLMAVGVVALLLHSPPPANLSRSSSTSARSVAEADPTGALLTHIGREIKAPLHGILSLATQVVDSLPHRLWIEKECVRRIVDSGHVMLCLLDNMLDFPMVSAAQLHLQTAPFSLVDEFDQVLTILKPSAFKKQITLETVIDVRYPQRLGDPKRFRQVLFNVAYNAIRFTQEKGAVRLYLTNTRLGGNRFEVRVEDTGAGIPSELVPHIFELPYLDPATKHELKCDSPGLSLAVSKLLCEAMNGHIECSSRGVGKGATFAFTMEIPVHDENAQEPVQLRLTDSLSLRRKSDSSYDAVREDLDNADAFLSMASAQQRWASRRHSVSHSTSDGSVSGSGSSMRKRRPSTVSGTQPSRPRRLRNKSESVDQLPRLRDAQPAGESSANGDQPATAPAAGSAERVVEDSSNSNPPQSAVSALLAHSSGELSLARGDSEVLAVSAAGEDKARSSGGVSVSRRGGSVIVSGKDQEQKLKQQQKSQELYQSLQGTRVLLVEDNVVNQKVAKLMLSTLGCEVSIAANGQIGLDLVAQRRPEEAFDVILMDLQMPVMDGFIASTKIREHERLNRMARTPIVTLTASTTSEYQDRCNACGMDGWLSKPFSKDQLATTIAAWRRKPQQQQQQQQQLSPPASPEFSPPSDDGFDAVAQHAAASSRGDHGHDCHQCADDPNNNDNEDDGDDNKAMQAAEPQLRASRPKYHRRNSSTPSPIPAAPEGLEPTGSDKRSLLRSSSA